MSSRQPLLSLNLKLRVLLLGFDNSDGSAEKAKELQDYLSAVFPSYEVPVISQVPTEESRLKSEETLGDHPGRRHTSNVHYAISYNVEYMDDDGHDQYIRLLKKHGRDRTNMGGDGRRLVVPIASISDDLEYLAIQKASTTSDTLKSSFGDTEVTLLVSNTNLSLLRDEAAKGAGDKNLALSFTTANDLGEIQESSTAVTCTRSWIGRIRMMIIDLSGACDSEVADAKYVGSYAHFSLRTECPFPSRSALAPHTVPSNKSSPPSPCSPCARLPCIAASEVGEALAKGQNKQTSFHVKISSLVISATRTVLAPAVTVAPQADDDSRRIIVPIIVFGGGNEENGKPGGVVNVETVKNAVEKMDLPAREVLVFKAGHHALDEHPQVSLAVAKSSVTHTRHVPEADQSNKWDARELYLDSAGLLREMKATGYGLPSSLLSYMGESAWEHLLQLDVAFAKESGLTEPTRSFRVLPVFILCLDSIVEHQEQPRLFEGNIPFAVEPGGDAVVVLQSKHSVEVSSLVGSGTLPLPLKDATPAVVAGLLQGLFGTIPPNRWWLPGHLQSETDPTWAYGYHPFAPFGIGGEPGELFVDVARRNAIATRAVAAATLLSESASMLENFVSFFVPKRHMYSEESTAVSLEVSELTRKLENMLDTARLSNTQQPLRTQGVFEALHSYQEEVISFEEVLKKAPRMKVAAALKATQESRNRAIQVRDQVKLAVERGEGDLRWCRCTYENRGDGSVHVSWIIFPVILITFLCLLKGAAMFARKCLLRYANSVGTGSGSGSGSGARW